MFAKGHGTQNDFVLLPDLDGRLTLDPAAVAALCDRRRGIGADGVLRVTTAGAAAGAGVFDRLPEGVGPGDWYMDYRNADGSIAQMCGNGLECSPTTSGSGLEPGRFAWVRWPARGRRYSTALTTTTAGVTVEMGMASRLGAGSANVGGRRFTGLSVDVGNPHLACVDPDSDHRRAGSPRRGDARAVRHRAVPRGRQRRVIAAPAGGSVSMRVHERGVGETRWCGTGTVAAAVAALAHQGAATGTLRGLHPRRSGHRHHHRRQQLPARPFGTGGPRRDI